jgi:nucleotidyltransferase substrate binding protein (TIGR01987 family)
MCDIRISHKLAQERLHALNKALQHISMSTIPKEIVSDALMRRFKFAIDTFWKFIKLYLEHVQKIELEIASPRGILRAAAEAKIISHDELNQLLTATTDRNLSSHAYEEDISEEVASRIPAHYAVLEAVFKRLSIE